MNQPLKTTIILVAIVAVIGFVSGVVGELWVNSFLLPDPYLNFKNFSDLSRRIDELISKDNQSNSGGRIISIDNIKRARSAGASIYRYKNLSNNQSVGLLPSDLVGQAGIVTNDGWLLTDSEVALFEKNVFWVELSDRRVYKAVVKVIDKEIGVAFLKIEVNDLAVMKFNLKNNLVNGEAVALFAGGEEVFNSNIKNLNYSELSGSNDFVHNSEKFYKYILLQDQLPKKYLGAPVLTMDGKMIGVYAGVNLVIPTDYFIPTMKSAVKGEKWQRSYLGLKFNDLSEILNDKNLGTRGVKIVFGGVKPDSPAKGLLFADDIILKVESDELNANNDLPLILSQYKPDEEIKLLVKRGNEEKNIDVKLDGVIEND